MNKVRRQQLKKWLEDLENIKNELERIAEDEQEYYDNIPENLQNSERATDSEAAIDQMNEAVSSLEDVICIIEEIM
jgi:chaperonin cofactor prefoldin